MFPEVFVQKHLAWSRPNDLIFDPFSGRGTTVFESLLNGRRAIAWYPSERGRLED